jgi:hypothetical protein
MKEEDTVPDVDTKNHTVSLTNTVRKVGRAEAKNAVDRTSTLF